MKSVFKKNWPLFAFALLLFSCKNEPKTASTNSATGSESTTPTSQPAPEVYAWTAAVSRLNLRETPAADGKVAAQLEKGTLLTGSGRHSENRVTMKLQDMDQEDYFWEVSTPDGKTGWVYGAAMTNVFAGQKAELPGADFQLFALALGKLPANSIESGGKAYGLLTSMMPKGGDAAFILMEKFMHDLVFSPNVSGMFESEAMQAKLEKEGAAIWQMTFDHSKFPETKRAAENGFRVNTAEGFYFPTVDFNRMKTAFAGHISAPTAQWLEAAIDEDRERTSEDGGVLISTELLVKRAIFWENWAKQNPHHVFLPKAKMDGYWMASNVLIGQSNTPVFDYESGIPTADFQKGWEEVLKNYPASDLAGQVKEIQAAVAADGGKRGPKTQAWIDAFLKEQPK